MFALADAIQPRYRLLILLAAFTSLRFGEFAALRRRDVNLEKGEIWVRRSQAELKHGRTVIKGPKSEAGKRRGAVPDVIGTDLRRHLEKFAESGLDGLVFVGPKGGRLRWRNFHRLWTKALGGVGLDGKAQQEGAHEQKSDPKGHAGGTTQDHGG